MEGHISFLRVKFLVNPFDRINLPNDNVIYHHVNHLDKSHATTAADNNRMFHLKLVELTGVEPVTSTLPALRSPN